MNNDFRNYAVKHLGMTDLLSTNMSQPQMLPTSLQATFHLPS